ncbi:MAG: hypothetical protein ACOC56_06095 [Atribacterota bacterium]
MNYAEELVKEIKQEPDENWTAEEFMKTFYPELYSGSSEKEITFKPLFSCLSLYLSELPETSFKFNYKHENKDPLKELGIEVVK